MQVKLTRKKYDSKYKGRTFRTKWGSMAYRFRLGEMNSEESYIVIYTDRDNDGQFLHSSTIETNKAYNYIKDNGWILSAKQIKLINITNGRARRRDI